MTEAPAPPPEPKPPRGSGASDWCLRNDHAHCIFGACDCECHA